MWGGIARVAAGASALLIVLPLPTAFAGPYATAVVRQASGTPSPPANGNSPFASCDISGFLIPGETNYVNTELEPWVAVNPTQHGQHHRRLPAGSVHVRRGPRARGGRQP